MTPQDVGHQAERSHQCSESDTESVRQIRRRRLVLQFEPDPALCQEEGREDPREIDDETSDCTGVPLTSSVMVGLESLDEVNLESVFEIRALVMKTVPKFMRGVFRGGIKTSLQAILCGRERKDVQLETRGWKLLTLMPRLLLARPPRGGLVPQGRLKERVARFSDQVVDAEGRKPGVADAPQKEKPEAVVWRGDQSLPTEKQGLTVLGVPVGHPDYIASELAKSNEQSLLFERIPHVEDVQVAWLLLTFCAATRANYWLRTVPREYTLDYAEKHDKSVNRCLEQILQMDDITQHIWESASMPLTLGGLGVGGASRMCDAAHWSSWADCLEMVQNRHPHIAHSILGGLATRTPGYLRAVQESGDRLRGSGVQVPSWEALAAGLRPEDVDMEPEPSQPKHGWQKFASVTIQNVHRETVVWPTLSPAEQAMVRSQSGPLASVPFTAMPTSRVTRISSDLFRVLFASPPISFAPLCSLLPVWPSPRRPWPPPRSLQHRRSIGQKGFRG